MYFQKPSRFPRGTSACDKPVVEPGGVSVAVLPFEVTIYQAPRLRAGSCRPTKAIGRCRRALGRVRCGTLEIGRSQSYCGVSLSSSRDPVVALDLSRPGQF